MEVKAIVYTSNTGYTAEYAKLLKNKTGLPCYTMPEAKTAIPDGSSVIYLGWVMASNVADYKKASKRYNVAAVCGVCLGTTGSQLDTVRKTSSIPSEIPLFTLQGGFDIKKLHGIYKFMMKIMTKYLKKQIGEKEAKTDDDKLILDMLENGGSAVREEHLYPLIELLDRK